MYAIDPHQSWLALEARAAATDNPLHRQLLTEVRDHMEFEIKGDLEPLMGTLIAEPVYHFCAMSLLRWRAARPSAAFTRT